MPCAGTGMNELVIANVNTDMRGSRFIGFKKNQVARFERVTRNRNAHLKLTVRHARQPITQLIKHVIDKTRTIKPARRSSGPNVRYTDKLSGHTQQYLRFT